MSMTQDNAWTDKVAIVTGGSSGIGRATALALAERGAKVVITGRDLTRLDAVADSHANLLPLRADSADPASADQAVAVALGEWGQLDLLVNNAGAGGMAPVEHYDADTIARICAINILAPSLMLKAALPGVEQHARDLRKELGEIATLREDIRNRRSELAAATQELQQERASLSALLDEKRRLRAQTEAEAEEAAKAVSVLADEAKSLGELLRNLQNRAEGLPVPRSRPDMRVAARTEPDADTLGATTIAKNTPPPPPESKTEPASSNDSGTNDTSDEEEFAVGSSITLAQGNLRMPASGKVVTLFGEKSRGPDGLTVNRSKGIEISTRANAQVVSPFDGKVVFAGPFRGYGRLLIIEHGEGYHSLIAGFDRLDSVVGQYLLAGEPVGIMGETSPKLYLEMRQNGEAINPLPWLASKNGKVSG